ncbi:hypothetical protein [Asticcacaulis sp.]|uniref:hypothetical protein n=1 Tax=Asticcacaulis sp. TaxID=1872648 RepID=UPI002D094A04|nr:hypothetical protein [Asticcacaulis sp.]HTM82032.1 hypothetical protein [Asticcacaulis sp.]
MLHSPLAIFGAIFLSFTCLAAFVFGSWRERAGAGLYLAAYVIANALNAMSHLQNLSHTITDILCLIGFVTLCWKSPHPWPLWAAGCQLASTMTGICGLLNVEVAQWTYMTLLIVSAYGVLLALLAGTLAAIGRRKKGAGNE